MGDFFKCSLESRVRSLEERLSGPSALYDNSPCHNVIHSPVVLEEEESDEDGKEECDGEVLIKCPHCRAVEVRTK